MRKSQTDTEAFFDLDTEMLRGEYVDALFATPTDVSKARELGLRLGMELGQIQSDLRDVEVVKQQRQAIDARISKLNTELETLPKLQRDYEKAQSDYLAAKNRRDAAANAVDTVTNKYVRKNSLVSLLHQLKKKYPRLHGNFHVDAPEVPTVADLINDGNGPVTVQWGRSWPRHFRSLHTFGND